MTTLNHYGHHPELELFLAGDCIITYSGEFIFPQENMSHYLIEGEEFYIAENLTNYVAPRFFPETDEPSSANLPACWETERQEVAELLSGIFNDLGAMLGGGAAHAAIAHSFSYAFLPVTNQIFMGKPGLWIQGPKACGKSIIARLLMAMAGITNPFPINFRGVTNAAAERPFSAYCGIPVHIDEWRNCEKRAGSHEARQQDSIEFLLLGAFSGNIITKGSPDGNSVTKIKPLTVPIITGEQVTNDPALLSRYITIQPNISADERTLEAIRHAMQDSNQYHRILRYILRFYCDFFISADFEARCYLSGHMPHDGSMRTIENHAALFGSMTAAVRMIYAATDPQRARDRMRDLDQWLRQSRNC